MHKFFYFRLAANNIRKNVQIYLPYIITCVLTIAMYYIMHSISVNEDILEMGITGEMLLRILTFGRYVVAVFSVIFLFYTNSFLMKRRKKEIGLWNVLGMEKRHILKVIAMETLDIAVISLLFGILTGILFEKLAYLVLLKIMNFEIVFGFHIYRNALLTTVILFGVIFLLVYIKSLWSVSVSRPIELLKGEAVGEKEPKAKWILAILGVLCIGSGYWISVTTKNPLQVIGVFFLAVLLVIIGTYFLFTAGTIAFLKLLKKNTGFYYKTNHFTAVSGMLYRMKRNAVGLANICVLSTMVLVMLSTTISMRTGMEDSIRRMYPSDFMMMAETDEFPEEWQTELRTCIDEHLLEVQRSYQYSYYDFSAIKEGNQIVPDAYAFSDVSSDEIMYCILISLEDYNRIAEANVSLQEGESLVYSIKDNFSQDTWQMLDKSYQIKERLTDFIPIYSNSIFTEAYIVMNEADIQEIQKKIKDVQGDLAGGISWIAGYDFKGSAEEKHAFYLDVEAMAEQQGWLDTHTVQLYEQQDVRNAFLNAYGGLLFVGIFLGILFTIATILIIYYKQISEGYEDRERYVIMQKVGMNRKEVKASIQSQILIVFFLPLLTAVLHVLFAYPVIGRLLRMLHFDNRMLFLGCILGCVIVFGILYTTVYAVTSKVYYKLVQWK